MQSELVEKLLSAGFETGWAVRDEKIILWINEDPIPVEFEQYVELDEVDNDN